MKIEHFQGGPSWCFRFMKRCNFSIRSRTTVAQQRPADYCEKLANFRSFCSRHIADKRIQPSHITNMDEVPLTWLRQVYVRRPGGFFHASPSLLVCDSMRAHITADVKQQVRQMNATLAVIPGGLTKELQPLDIGVNRPFKVRLRAAWERCLTEGEHSFTKGGRQRRASYATVCQWIVAAWANVSAGTVVRAFAKAGIISEETHGAESDSDEKATKVTKAGKIPRYQGLQLKNKQLKPVTPNFKKLHEAHFNKMESIDSYMQRKTKQMDTYRSSVKELKNLSDKTKLQQADGKTRAKANLSRTSILSPVPVNKRTADGRRTLLSASKAPLKEAAGKEDAPFRPSVLSTRRINVRFTEATKDNEFKRSLVKTPSRMSPCVASSTPQIQTTGEVKSINVKTTTFSAAKTPGAFIFTGNTSTAETPGTQKKQTFDLKASLSRPLSYKPHTGKLKAFGDVKENTTTAAADKSLISNSHQTNYKKHQVQTRDNRREKHTADRKQKKESALGARRGLVMM